MEVEGEQDATIPSVAEPPLALDADHDRELGFTTPIHLALSPPYLYKHVFIGTQNTADAPLDIVQSPH
jgi:hypothetical protein